MDSDQVSRDWPYSGTFRETTRKSLTGLSPSMVEPFQTHSASRQLCNSHVRNPTTPQRKTSAVWAIPISLAATKGIDFSFYSTGYLDVSVHQVSLHAPMYSVQEQFGNPGINARLSTPPGLSQTSTPFIAF